MILSVLVDSCLGELNAPFWWWREVGKAAAAAESARAGLVRQAENEKCVQKFAWFAWLAQIGIVCEVLSK